MSIRQFTNFGLFFVLIVGILVVSPGKSATASEVAVSPEIEKALLAEDWETVAKKCGPNEKLTASPVLRAIKGHACLALNRNNESLDLFVTIASDQDRQEWKKWATDFADRKYPTNPVSNYLKGDALARVQEWKPALKSFNKALTLKPNWYLALNARGVVNHVIGNIDEARSDFDLATRNNPDFADAYASWGTFNIHQGSVKGAASNFQEALNKSQAFALAINGRGCASYGAKHFAKAMEDFNSIRSDSAVYWVARYNLLAVELGKLDKAIDEAEDAGMNILTWQGKRNQLENEILNYFFGKDKGGRLPDGGRKPPTRPGSDRPRPGGEPKPGPRPGPEQPPVPGTWPKPPVWVPQPGPPPLPDDPNPPKWPVPDNFSKMVAGINKDLNRGMSKEPIKPGGVKTKKIGANRGNWLVINWYGLAYSVPPKSVLIRMPEKEGSTR